MRTRGWEVAATSALVALLAAGTAAQDHGSGGAPPIAPPRATKGTQAPTHAPQPVLSPLDAWTHVKRGNEGAAAARARRENLPPPQPRPAGAGRHVCAVIVCADCDLDVPALLGLPRQDVLLISTPGPFVTPEITALLEQAIGKERLSLVLMLSHSHCTTFDVERGASPQQDALAQRLAAVRADAERTRTPFAKALLLAQREQLLAASEELRRGTKADTLRIMPGELDTRTGAIAWLHRAADAMPLAPVR